MVAVVSRGAARVEDKGRLVKQSRAIHRSWVGIMYETEMPGSGEACDRRLLNRCRRGERRG